MRLIDADELLKAINSQDMFACLPSGKLEPFRNLDNPYDYDAYVHYIDILRAIKWSVTVEERPSAEWEFREIPKTNIIGWWCSNCHIGEKAQTPYCPNCGAKMGGDNQ